MTIEVTDIQTVSPATLRSTLDGMSRFYRRFVDHQDETTADLMVLWAAHTHGMAVWTRTPRLYITAPEPACGKSTAADLLSFFTANPLSAASMSGAALFRSMDALQPTVFLDEADKTFNGSWGRDNVLASTINQGYQRDGVVVRMEKGLPKPYQCYGAMAIVGIDNGFVPDDTRSRCIPVIMGKAKRKVEDFDKYDHLPYQEEALSVLSNAAMSWTKDADLPEWLSGRDAQIWRPLFSIAQWAGGNWPERVLAAAEYHRWDKPKSVQNDTLRAVRDYFNEHSVDKVQSSTLTQWLATYDTLPDVTPKGLAKTMAAYGVKPHKVSVSLYLRRDLEPVWKTWL